MLLTDCVLTGKLVKPFTMVPPDAHLPVFNKAEVSSQLSSKFKAFQKSLNTKQLEGKVFVDKDAENQDPQLINIQSNTMGSFCHKGRENLEKPSKFRTSSLTKRGDLARKSGSLHRDSSENFDPQEYVKRRKHNYEPGNDIH